MRYFRENGLKFPNRSPNGLNKGEIIWTKLSSGRAVNILHNPCYAGIYAYGKCQSFKELNKKRRFKKVPRDKWFVFLPEHHQGYISQEQFEINQRRLLENSTIHSYGSARRPPREGPALLQGIVFCGICSSRMMVRYYKRKKGGLLPSYVCDREVASYATKVCQNIAGASIDEAIGNILVELMTPYALDAALAVQKELESQIKEVEQLLKITQRQQCTIQINKHPFGDQLGFAG